MAEVSRGRTVDDIQCSGSLIGEIAWRFRVGGASRDRGGG